MVVVTFVIILA